MSLLEDAKRLATEEEPVEQFEHGGRRYFVFCGRLAREGHASDCPWLSMPRIVAALEAAEQLVKAWEGNRYPEHWTDMKLAVDAYRVATEGEVALSPS